MDDAENSDRAILARMFGSSDSLEDLPPPRAGEPCPFCKSTDVYHDAEGWACNSCWKEYRHE